MSGRRGGGAVLECGGPLPSKEFGLAGGTFEGRMVQSAIKKGVLDSLMPERIIMKLERNGLLVPSVGRVLPGRLDTVIHSQPSCKSISCRLFWMLRRFHSTCELPLTNFHKQQGPQITQTGQKRRTQRQTSSHARNPQQAKETRRERTTT